MPLKSLGRFKVTKAVSSSPSPQPKRQQQQLIFILFGWVNCNDRHLEKYARMFHALGADVVFRRCPSNHELLSTHFRTIDHALSDVLDHVRTSYPTADVMMMFFSGGGSAFYCRLMRLLSKGMYVYS